MRNALKLKIRKKRKEGRKEFLKGGYVRWIKRFGMK